MKIAVVGAGAMGGLFGSLLTQSGEDVYLVDIWAEHVNKMNRDGLKVIRPDGETTVKVKATTDISSVGTPDMIIFSVKGYDTDQAAHDCLKIVGPETIIFTVQNGVGNVEKIGAVLGAQRIIAGTTSFGCTVMGPGCIKPSPTGAITIGELSGNMTERLAKVIAAFENAGVEMHSSDGVDRLIWSKLIVNVGINALTAITLLKNGQLLDYPGTETLMAKAVDEAVRVAQKKGIHFLVEDPLQWVKDVARGTADNKSSMRQDIEKGRKTEVGSINGAVVREGASLGIPTPVNEVLTLLVKTLEEKGLQR